MLDDLQLISDPPAGGVWNMAVDEALLQAAADGNAPTLRFYQWSEPTLSLGYFQRLADRNQHFPSRECTIIRRPSGGGAIVHDCELTYSLTIPPRHPQAMRAAAMYRGVHQALRSALAERGLAAELCENERSAATQPFLCFERRGTGDLVLRNRSADSQSQPAAKIAGSAQRRHKGAILQHGSVLLGRSSAAPELLGIAELANVSIAPGELIEAWQSELVAWFQSPARPSQLPPDVRERAGRLADEKHGTPGWLDRR